MPKRLTSSLILLQYRDKQRIMGSIRQVLDELCSSCKGHPETNKISQPA